MRRIALVFAACAVVVLALVWGFDGDESTHRLKSDDPSVAKRRPGLEGTGTTAPPAVIQAHHAPPQPASPDSAAIVSGTVLDSAGRSAQGVRIAARNRSDGKHVGSTTSDSDGAFRLVLPQGAYRVRVVADERWACEQTFYIDESTADLVFRLHGGQTLRGTVVGEDDASSTLTAVTVEWNGNRKQKATVSPDGQFRFQMPANARGVRLWVQRNGRFWRVPLDADALARHVGAQRPTWHELRGTVQTETGAYLKSGTVRVAALDTSLHFARRAVVTADSPGTFRIEGLQAGPYVVTVDSPELSQTIRRRVEVPVAPISLKLAGRRPVSVRVTGATPRMALFVIRDARVRSIEKRMAVYEDPFSVQIPMSTDVQLVYVGNSDPGEDRFAIATVDAFTRSIELDVRPGLAIEGTMEIPAGTGRVFIEAHPIGRATSTEVRKDGSFRIGGLPPGTYRLHWVVGSMQGGTNWSQPVEAGAVDVHLVAFP